MSAALPLVVLGAGRAALAEARLIAESEGATLLARPLAASMRDARRVRAAAEAPDAPPVLVGHHRRHHAVVGAAREVVRGGLLGRLVGVQSIWVLRAPEPDRRWAWRVESGGGVAFVQLVHELDLIRHVAGEIRSVAAHSGFFESHGARADAGALALELEGGALATALLSDVALSPWGWEAATGEDPEIPATGEDCLRLVGAEGALSLPSLACWRHAGEGRGDATRPLTRLPMPCPPTDPRAAQLAHFLAVARGEAAPLSTVEDAQRSLAVAFASFESAREGVAVRPDPDRLGPWEAAAEAIAAQRTG